MKGKLLLALAGQPNCGKSTMFNMLTGARQHVANYPGVTVEKKSGYFSHGDTKYELVDLPGTYSLTSYSLEERVARDFLLHDKPALTINVAEAPNLRRSLSLTFQLLEMETPLAFVLNMMDMAEKRNITIDSNKLSELLGVPVAKATARSSKGKDEVIRAIQSIDDTPRPSSFRIDYGSLETSIAELQEMLESFGNYYVPTRWLAIKLLENDSEAWKLVSGNITDSSALKHQVTELATSFRKAHDEEIERHISFCRHKAADAIVKECVVQPERRNHVLSDKIDSVVCHKIMGPMILLGVILLLYYLSIDVGYKLTEPLVNLLMKGKSMLITLLPDPGIIVDPTLRSLGIWFLESLAALLIYIPIFLILFAFIAVLEDSGYMPRMAFILDRIFRNYGLHGQSTLPLILGGVYMGGCAVPGVMATKGIPDERARMATIMVVPMMNCLAKVPLYVVLVAAFFPQNKTMAMFFISTVTIFMALPVAKALTISVLKKRESAPFIMEMPSYHFPTIRAVLQRSVERTWLFLQKIVTIVAAVAVVVFALLQFPGLSQERMDVYNAQWDKAEAVFFRKIGTDNPYAPLLKGDGMESFIVFADAYQQARTGVTNQEKANAIFAGFQAQNPKFSELLKPAKTNKAGRAVKKAFRKLSKARKKIRREIKKERLDNSFLGRMGEALVPFTQFAGFDTKVNISLLAAFAAKESTVSTLGALYTSDEDQSKSLDKRLQTEMVGYTPLHALALMLFMALYPPCLATTIMVRMQAGSTKWMLFSIAYMMFLGITVSSLVFTGGSMLGLTGIEAMWTFYGLAVLATIVMGLYNPKPSPNHTLKEKHA